MVLEIQSFCFLTFSPGLWKLMRASLCQGSRRWHSLHQHPQVRGILLGLCLESLSLRFSVSSSWSPIAQMLGLWHCALLLLFSFIPPLFLILFSKLSIGFLFLQFLNSGSCFCCSLKITCLSQLRLLCGCVISLGMWSSLLPVYRPFPPGGLRLISWWRFPWLSACL